MITPIIVEVWLNKLVNIEKVELLGAAGTL